MYIEHLTRSYATNNFNMADKNSDYLKLNNLIKKNRSSLLEKNKNIHGINMFNASELLKINNKQLYHQTRTEINLFLLKEVII